MNRILASLAGVIFFIPVTFGAGKPANDNPRALTTSPTESGRIVIEAHTAVAPVPLFFSTSVDQTIVAGSEAITGVWQVKVRVAQGNPEVLTLGLSGDGEIVEVTGGQLRDWSVRNAGTIRFLDLRPNLPEKSPAPREFDFVVHTRHREPTTLGPVALLLASPGAAVGFASHVTLQWDAAVDLRVTAAEGVVPLSPAGGLAPTEFQSTGDQRIEVRLSQRGAGALDAELLNAQLTGRVEEHTRSVAFMLRGQLRAGKAGARVTILSGRAALSQKPAGDGWHIDLVATDDDEYAYQLIAERAGMLTVELSFVAALLENGDWHGVEFKMPAGAIVPLRLEGVDADVEFSPAAPVVPTSAGSSTWVGFLPVDGAASLAWKRTRETAEETLAFTSSEQTEVRVGAGLLRQTTQLTFRILQGKLSILRLQVEGPGEVLGVEGPNVAGWKVFSTEPGRMLEVQLSRPFESDGTVVVRTQAALGGFPVRAEPVRVTPQGVVRHSGHVRIANIGAVRLEVTDPTGLMQLAPGQFPGGPIEGGARQVFVFRFPTASYGYHVAANQIQPEVSVTHLTTYELGETDRVIHADLELDIREAPLRDWSLQVPADYAVVAVAGSEVADYVAETEATGGLRSVKVLFRRAVDGRQLLRLRLEKSQPAAAGEWRLPAVMFPGAKSVRGHVGAVAAPGFRIVPAQTDELIEVPLSYFPKQVAGLQQTWRLRDPEWTATLNIEALGQSIQADVFHLYSLKEGVVHGSVLLNYFVVGAPANEWRIEVPETVGNIDVTGQNVRRDWRRDGNHVIVTLHQPVLGAATLLVTFEQPMSARGGAIRPGEIRPLNVQSERGFIQVVSPLQVKHEIRTSEGSLLRLEPLELPMEFRLLTSAPSLATYQYTARPFALELGIEWYEPGELVDQIVDFAKLASQVSRDGEVVTDARFFVKTRGRKALRLVLPAGMQLWEARVERELVNAQADGEQTLVPLPPRLNPNEPVEVALRLGQKPENSSTRITLNAPRLLVPVVINEWTLRGDPERLLVPAGGNAELITPTLTESGFEWIATRGRTATSALIALVLVGVVLLRNATGWRVPAGLLVCGAGAFFAFVVALEAMAGRRPNLAELTYATTVVPAGGTIAVQVKNVVAWQAMTSWWGVAAALGGVTLLIAVTVLQLQKRIVPGFRPAPAVGLVLIAAGLLAQHGGAILLFAGVGCALFTYIVVLGLVRWKRGRRSTTPADPGAAASAAGSVVPLLLLSSVLGAALTAPDIARADDAAEFAASLSPRENAAQSMVQTWTIRGDRLHAELDLVVRGNPGDSFLLLRAPAVLTDFRGEGLRVVKVERDGELAYVVVPEREGLLSAKVRFETAVHNLTAGLPVLTGSAATQVITINLDQGGWEFASPFAVQISPTANLSEGHSGATLVLGPGATPRIDVQPRRRDLTAETPQFFAEAATLFLPGPGVVNGYARVTIRPTQGRVTALELDVPTGFTVGEVVHGPVGEWRYDPVTRRLKVAVEPAQGGTFRFDVAMQMATPALPVDLALTPLRVPGAVGEVGMIAIGFSGDAQPEALRPEGLSVVNLEDFDADLVPRDRDGQPAAILQHAWRYGHEGGTLNLKAAPVAAEVRVATKQILSIGDDRLVMKLDVAVAITRVGLFQLSFALPDGLEVEALSGASLSQWTEAVEGGERIVTLHLAGRTIGEQTFALTLSGAAPATQESWSVPRVLVREATRHTGELLLVPEKGIRLRTVDRTNATQLDPRGAGGMQPGTLAFRLLQHDWALAIGVEALEPWVTVQALQDVTLREGQTLTRISVRYRVDNASVKQLRVRLPGLTEAQARTVRATGTAVSDFVPVANEADLWDLRFQRGITGDTDVQIEFQGQPTREGDRENVATPEFVGARQTTLFVALRAGGRLELEAGTAPRGWQRLDWSSVPPSLQARGDHSVPTLSFRVAEPEQALAVAIRRHDVAEALKLRVTRAGLTTIFSPTGAFLTALHMHIDVLEKSTLRVRLPAAAQLFNTFVNGQSVTVVREGDAYLFHVTPDSEANASAEVRLVYAVTAPAPGGIQLAGPSLNIPLENVSWRVVLPPGHTLLDYAGTLRLRSDSFAGWFGIDQYQSSVVTKRSADAQKASALLQEANNLLQRGEQDRAGEMLSQVTNLSGVLDDASNEDARVQLRALKEQQAMLSLNTRRQRLYLDNRADGARNEQLEQAANLNPYMQGKTNFDPSTVDQLLMGNSAEENTALRGIASRIVAQQLDAEPTAGAIDLTLPERGRVVEFTRSVHVDGGAPLALQLTIARESRTSSVFVGLALAAVAAIAFLAMPRHRSA